MTNIKYNKSSPGAQNYKILIDLMNRWEDEIVEFKEASGQYSIDRIGQYFSAISNEANLKQQQYGWLVLGVSEGGDKHPVGTSFKQGEPILLEKFKYAISRDITDGPLFLILLNYFQYMKEKCVGF